MLHFLFLRQVASLPQRACLAPLSVTFFTILAPLALADSPDSERHFEQSIRPLLVNHCLKCHGPEKQESGFRVDAREPMLAGGVSGTKAIVPGSPDESLIVKAVRHDGDLHMPPDTKLSSDEVAALEKWIREGAVFPSTGPAVKVASIVERAMEHRSNHWAFQAVQSQRVPEVQDQSWPANAVDQFILAKLEAANLKPSAEADRATLIRRLSFDLLGLPPSAEEVKAFVADASPLAYEQLVERLLASPTYGQRWARHWLDVARYGDTRGYAFTNDRRYPYAYTYRDYVVDSFNADRPYNQFVREQLAADLLPYDQTSSENKSLAALGFLTVGRKFNNRNDDLDDQIDVVTRGLMGITVACARCHDHKYDGIPSEDYYSLYGVFAGSGEPETTDLPLIGNAENNEAYLKFKAELDQRKSKVDAYLNERYNDTVETTRKNVADYLIRVHDLPAPDVLAQLSFLLLKPDQIREPILRRWREYLQPRVKADDAMWGLWAETVSIPSGEFAEKAPAVIEKWKQLPDGLVAGQCNPLLKAVLGTETVTAKHDIPRLYGKLMVDAWNAWKAAGGNNDAVSQLPEPQRAWAMALVAPESPSGFNKDNTRAYLRRDERNQLDALRKEVAAFEASSPEAPPRAMVLKENGPFNPRVFLRGNPGRPGPEVPRRFLLVVAGNERQPFPHGGGRLDLAEAITATDNPLTRRVFVNRMWMHLFGEALVNTPSDFGIRTERPVHAELLDYLAAGMLETDWSIKSLHRALVLSQTYRQSSAARPDGAAVDPENRLWHRALRKRLEWEALRDSMLASSGRLDSRIGGRGFEIGNADERRRTLYATIDRQDLPNLFRVFDLASPDQSAPRRARTTVPQQSLFMMNSPFVVNQAFALASRPDVAAVTDPPQRVAAIYRAALGREPSGEESTVAVEFIRQCSEQALDSQLDPWQQIAQVLLLTNEFAHVD